MRICGDGWRAWEPTRDALAGWRCVWIDLAGPHVDQLPASAPDATHVWAWRGDCWARVRIDEGEAIVGFLHGDGNCPASRTDCSAVAVSEVMLADTWSEPHLRVGDQAGAKWEVIEIVEGVATQFVRLAAHPADH